MFVQKLPALEPEMRGALRNHVIRKRRRLKQELEQDAIEKRMKKERELKKIQDEMTLDQIKEQLQALEKKLESLRSEKHDLFVQLKQVLNDKNSKRKPQSEQSDANQQQSQQQQFITTKTSQIAKIATVNEGSNQNHSPQKVLFAPTSNFEHKLVSQPLQNASKLEQISPSSQTLPITCNKSQITSNPSNIQARVHNFIPRAGAFAANHANLPTPPVSIGMPYTTSRPINHLHNSSTTYKVNSLGVEYQTQARANLSLMGRSDINSTLPLDFGAQRLRFGQNSRPMLMDLPISLVSNHRDLTTDYTKNGLKRPASIANSSASELIEERLFQKKRPIAPSNFPSSPRYPSDLIVNRGFYPAYSSDLLNNAATNPHAPINNFTSIHSTAPNLHQSQHLYKSNPNPQIQPNYHEFLTTTNRQPTFFTPPSFNPALYPSNLLINNPRMTIPDADLSRQQPGSPNYHNLPFLSQQHTNLPRHMSPTSSTPQLPIDRGQRVHSRNTYGSHKTNRNP